MALAMKGGVNYYDTAWGYHSGQSELVMGPSDKIGLDKPPKKVYP